MIYFAIILLSIAFSPLCKKKILFYGEGGIEGKLVYCFLFATILTLVCGLRDETIGRDTVMYNALFDEIVHWNHNLSYIIRHSETELGYTITEWLFSFVGEYHPFLILVAFFSVFPVLWVIYKYSNIPWLSILLFISFGYFTFFLSGIRQSIALGLCMIAFHFSNENKLKHYLFFIFLALSFHSSAILFLPVYWIKKINLKFKQLISYSIFGLIIVLIFRTSIYLFLNKYSRQDYGISKSAGGELFFALMIISSTIGILNYKKMDGFSRVLLYMMIISALTYPVLSVGSAAMHRMRFYYHIFVILYVPAVTQTIKTKTIRIAVIVFFIASSLLFFVKIQLSKEILVYPYSFFWEK